MYMTSQDLPESKEVSQWLEEESRLVRKERDFYETIFGCQKVDYLIRGNEIESCVMDSVTLQVELVSEIGR